MFVRCPDLPFPAGKLHTEGNAVIVGARFDGEVDLQLRIPQLEELPVALVRRPGVAAADGVSIIRLIAVCRQYFEGTAKFRLVYGHTHGGFRQYGSTVLLYFIIQLSVLQFQNQRDGAVRTINRKARLRIGTEQRTGTQP